MFTFDATPVKFVGLLLFFAWCTAWYAYEAVRPAPARRRVGLVLHLVMAVVMLAMVAPVTWQPLARFIPALTALFAAGALWFGWLWFAERGRVGARAFLGHAVMFVAMAWHLAAMGVKRSFMMGAPGQPGMGHGSAAGKAAVQAASAPGGPLWWIGLVGIPLMVYLLVAGILDVRRALRPRAATQPCACGHDCTCGDACTCAPTVPASDEVARHAAEASGAAGGTPRPAAAASGATVLAPVRVAASCHATRPVGTPGYRASALADAAMNLGMFWMSTGILVPVLAFMAVFAF